MSRNIADLKKEALELGLTVKQTAKRESKTDYELALRDYYWQKENGSAPMPPQIDPMLAEQTKGMDEATVEMAWKNFMMQEKVNGCRGILMINPMGDGKNLMQSRRISDKNYRFTLNTDAVPHLRDLSIPDCWDGTILDGELQSPVVSIDTEAVVTEGILQSTIALLNCAPEKSVRIQQKFGLLTYKVFDIIQYKGMKVVDCSYLERHLMLGKFFEENASRLKSASVELLSVRRADYAVDQKKAEYERIVAAGGEGVMLKDPRGTYEQGKRVKSLLKMKKFIEIDAFVIGGEVGDPKKGQAHLIADLIFGAYNSDDGKLIEVAKCSAFTIKEKESWTEVLSSGKLHLKDSCLNRVFVIRGQEFSSRNYRLTHATPETERFDKAPEDCTLSLNEIKRIVKEQR